MNEQESFTELLLKVSPPVAVSGVTLGGLSIPDIVQILTGIYVVIMMGDKAYIMFRRWRQQRLETLRKIENGTEE